MKISDRLTRLKPSATLAINAKALELKAKGREIISLAVGEPDFPTPLHIRDAAKKALDQGHTRYTPVPGVPALREAISGYFKRFYNVDAAMENTIASMGGKQALYNLFMALLNPGDEVLIPAPYWVSYPPMVELAQGVPVIVPTQPENTFLVSVADLEKQTTSNTKMIILNTPSNPTGCHYPQAHLLEIAEWAVKKNIFIVSDEVYDRLVYAPATPSTLSKFWEKQPEQVAVVNALSKSFCMTGFRMGYTLGHPDLIKAVTKIQGQSTSNVNSIAQQAAIPAFSGSWDIVEEVNHAFQARPVHLRGLGRPLPQAGLRVLRLPGAGEVLHRGSPGLDVHVYQDSGRSGRGPGAGRGLRRRPLHPILLRRERKSAARRHEQGGQGAARQIARPFRQIEKPGHWTGLFLFPSSGQAAAKKIRSPG